MKKHTILFLAANPLGTDRLALDREARSIHVELKRSGYRDCFELVTRWAVEPLDLLRELRELKPTVVHFSGHGDQNAVDEDPPAEPRRDVISEPSFHESNQGQGLFFQGPDGRPQFVSGAALTQTFGAAGASVKLVVLNACYSEVQAAALVAHVDCVVGMGGSIQDDATRNFAIGFYGGLGERESVAAAYRQGCAAISLEGLPDADRPQLAVRVGIDAEQLVLAADPPASPPEARPVGPVKELPPVSTPVGAAEQTATMTPTTIIEFLDVGFPTAAWEPGDFYVEKIHFQNLAGLVDLLDRFQPDAYLFPGPQSRIAFDVAVGVVRRIVRNWEQGGNLVLKKDGKGRNPVATIYVTLRQTVALVRAASDRTEMGRRAERIWEDVEIPVIKNPDIGEGAEFPATVVFVLIQGLKDCSDGPKVPNALRALNEALRGVDASAFVLSTIAGVIIVIPDAASWNVEDTFAVLDRAKVGFSLRVGVTHGPVEVVMDIDDEPNLIGPPINIAARLAISTDNTGSLIHESYTRFVDGTLSATHWLHRSVRKAISITGKPQDPPFACFAGPHTFDARLPERHEQPRWQTAVLVAYDLPKFSAGDRAQLRKRFTRLVHVFKKLRQSSPMPTAAALLSPGGDGGVLVLDGLSLPAAAAISSRLRELTEIESLDLADAITVETRIGVHYGRVTHYVNARGIDRPTGLEVFVADEIAGDAHARDRNGIILTRLLADSLAGGSNERLTSEFDPLPPLTSGPASGVERFVQRSAARPR